MVEWQEIAELLKNKAWDISEDWLQEAKNDLSLIHNYISLTDEDLISDLPTIVGGIANAIIDPVYLEDFHIGGNLFTKAQYLGESRHQNGYQIEKVLSDYSLLRQKIWDCIKTDVQFDSSKFFELEHRINSSIDKIAEASVQSYYQRSSMELLELAYKDRLTGFLHLKSFVKIVNEEIDRARRYRRPLSLVIVDVDKFREFNLEHGRLSGNQLLQDIARNIAGTVRITDKSARLGGDEFGILMPENEVKSAKISAERIRRIIRQETYRDNAMVTLSVGIAAYPHNASAGEDLLREARLSLAQAQKKGGDNTWISAKKVS